MITPGPAVTINTVEGFQNVNMLVSTFTAPTIPFAMGPRGLPASDFTASIDWHDPLTDHDTGTITQDAQQPQHLLHHRHHTFAENGTFNVTSRAFFSGGTISQQFGPVTVTVTYPGDTASTPLATATANVTQGPLAVSAFPLVATEGIANPSSRSATFIDAGGPEPIGDYAASISIFDAANNLVVGPLIGGITQAGNANQFNVTVPGFTLPEEGTYQLILTVTDSRRCDADHGLGRFDRRRRRRTADRRAYTRVHIKHRRRSPAAS